MLKPLTERARNPSNWPRRIGNMTNPTMMLMMRYLRSVGLMRHTFGFSFSDWIGGGICAADYMQVQKVQVVAGFGAWD